MKRRGFLSAIAALPIVATNRAGAQDATACTCVKMEDREGVLIFEGAGNEASELFDLKTGRYRVEMEFEDPSEYIKISIMHENAENDLDGRVYGDYDAKPTASTTLRIEETGKHFLQVETTVTGWKVAISPL